MVYISFEKPQCISLFDRLAWITRVVASYSIRLILLGNLK